MSKPGALTYSAALAAIEGILAALPASELPRLKLKTDKDGRTLAWCDSSRGWYLGSAKRTRFGVEQREPLIYRNRGAADAIEQEAVYRADLKHLAKEQRQDGAA